jgi:polyphosphate kinase
MSLNLAVIVRDEEGVEHFARVKVPNTLPRVIKVGESRGRVRLVWLEQVVAAYLADLFPGMQVVESHQFRVTRDAEIAIQELEAEDLLETVERSIRRRRFGSVVRLVIDRDTPESIKAVLEKNLQIGPEDVYEVSLPLAMSDLGSLFSYNRPDMKDDSFVPADPVGLEGLEGPALFAAIRQGDVLLHHPYESFQPVIDFLETAARDPDVLAIKQTLYRVGKNAPIVAALLEAARRGKQVAVLVELKARFDEESNIEWARMLEREGVHVIYGLPGFKTHCKVALVVRREGDGIRRYVHLATGNYNAVTATQYTDLGMFTAREEYGADASDLFNYLTGYSKLRSTRKLLVAPVDFRTGVESLIRREIEHSLNGKKGHLIFKINSLVDKKMIALLYEASRAGVKVELVVRGICCLRPGLPGISENVTVRSIVGRFLEHSRILYFDNDGSPECYLGSADLMPRNLDKRVEVLFPVESPPLVERLRNEILESYLADNVKARLMQSDGSYMRAAPAAGEKPLDCQAHFLALAYGRYDTLLGGEDGSVPC